MKSLRLRGSSALFVSHYHRPLARTSQRIYDRPIIPSLGSSRVSCANFHISTSRHAIRPFLLADIGEGIREVQIIQWFVKPGARVEQFDKLCEVSSDKATVEITSRFDGVIKKLHYEADDMALVGKPLVDIDIQSDIAPEDEALVIPPEEQAQKQDSNRGKGEESTNQASVAGPQSQSSVRHIDPEQNKPTQTSQGRHAALATPAVRHAAKEHNINLSSVEGTGKDGRVLKEDIHRHAAKQKSQSSPATEPRIVETASNAPDPSQDRTASLTPNQMAMFKTMTASLSIPHFLYTSTLDLTALTAFRQSLNAHPLPASASSNPSDPPQQPPQIKLSLLPFLLKALSLALTAHPLLNARLDTKTNGAQKPLLHYRNDHNLGVAVDTAQGLLVPVIASAQNHSILSLAAEIQRLAQLARTSKLQHGDMQGGTFTVSNIGSVGAGGVVAPVIVEGQTAIIGVGRSKVVPAFNEQGELVKREECVLSWSADHRIADGGTVARCAEMVRELLEKPERLLVRLK